jgi:uncharacterized protein (TIGR03435 family)
MRTCLVAMLSLLWIPSSAFAQGSAENSSTDGPKAKKQFEFEIFSIRLHKPGSTPSNLQLNQNGYIATTDLEFAIKLAYFPKDWRKWSSWKIQNAPAWVHTDWYDVNARVAEEDLAAWQADIATWQKSFALSDIEFLRSAWQAALRERCKIAVSTTPVKARYLDLTVGKRSALLKETVPGAIKPIKFKTSKLGEGFYIEDNGERRFVGVSMEEFAAFLTRSSPDYPVQDKTGLTGRYDFTLPWYDRQHYPESEFSNPLDRMPISGIGLTLKRGTGPAFILNVDHIERPDPN